MLDLIWNQDGVCVWQALLDSFSAKDLGIHLSSAEVDRACQIRHTLSRNRFIVRRALLRSLLSQELGHFEISIGLQGKPFIVDSAMEFSMSSSEGFGLFALSKTGPVGVDVQAIGDQDPQELSQWVCRVAVGKAQGTGILGEIIENLPIFFLPVPEGFIGAIAIASKPHSKNNNDLL